MKDHEIIAILEGCDEAQRARVMTWARKRWPAPKRRSGPAPATPAQPVANPIDPEAFRRFVEEMRRAKPVPLPDPTQAPPYVMPYVPPPYLPAPFTQPTPPPDWGPLWTIKVTCGVMS